MKQNKKIVFDSLWSISGLVLVNAFLQLAVYPVWQRRDGAAALGNHLYLISLINVVAMSLGVSIGYARLKQSSSQKANNAPYLLILCMATPAVAMAGVLISLLAGVEMSLAETLALIALICAVMWRYYLEVYFKLSLNYKSYFFYHLWVTVGYAIGALLFFITGTWTVSLLAGELTAIFYVIIRGNITAPYVKPQREEVYKILRLTLLLFLSEMLSSLIFNADRILLKTVLDELAVTKFYLSSLLGKTAALLTSPLTGVIAGYLSKRKNDLTVGKMNLISLLAAVSIFSATALCTVGSHILIPILYPEQTASVERYFVMANMSQIVYFVGSVMSAVLLFFSKSRFQLYITAVYVSVFLIACIPLAIAKGFYGFCIGLVFTCTVRLFVTVFLGYYTVRKNNIEKQNSEL